MGNSIDQAVPLTLIQAEWHADQVCWIATNVFTGEDIAQAGTLAEIEFQVLLWANRGDDSAPHFKPIYDQGLFLLH